MPKIGDLPDPLKSINVDLENNWTVLDQTKAEFKNSGRSGVFIMDGPEDSYRAKVSAFLAKYDTKWDFGKDCLVIEHTTQARELYEAMRAAGLRVELVLAEH